MSYERGFHKVSEKGNFEIFSPETSEFSNTVYFCHKGKYMNGWHKNDLHKSKNITRGGFLLSKFLCQKIFTSFNGVNFGHSVSGQKLTHLKNCGMVEISDVYG